MARTYLIKVSKWLNGKKEKGVWGGGVMQKKHLIRVVEYY